MSYRLYKEETLQHNIQRVVSEEIDKCIASLQNLEINEAVHDIRKRLKKIRAVARLVRKDLGEKKYKSINIYFRDLGRELSRLRDLASHMETIQMLEERYGNHIYTNFFKSINSELQSERDALEEKLRENQFFKGYLLDKLEKAKTDLVEWPLSSSEMSIVVPGIQKVYKRGSKALKESYKSADAAVFHEWRKRAKYLWYHLRLLRELWPGLFKKWQHEAHILANYLGDDHDLMILNEKINSYPDLLKSREQQEMLQGLIHEMSSNLRLQAHELGALIYAEKPADFKNRMKKYVKISRF